MTDGIQSGPVEATLRNGQTTALLLAGPPSSQDLAARLVRWGLSVGLAALSLITSNAHAGASTLSGLEYVIDTWDTDDGLPENSGTAIAQTSDGYLWLGTWEGLVRFDGFDFEVFNPQSTPQIPSEGIVNLYVDRRNRLWVSTSRGLVVRDGEEWHEVSELGQGERDYVRTFTERANGDLLITSFNGSVFEYSGGQLQSLPPPPGESEGAHLGGVDGDGHWWVAHTKFVGRWEHGRWVSTVTPPDMPRDSLGFCGARDGGLWLLLGDEILKLKGGSTVARVALQERLSGVWRLTEDRLGHLWVATRGGGFYQVFPSGRMTQWNAKRGVSDFGRCVFEDREGNLWLGTSGEGLRRLKPRRLTHFALDPDGQAPIVRSLCLDLDEGLWVATRGRGLFRLSEAGAAAVALPKLNDYLESVLLDRAGRLWIGVSGRPTYLLEEEGSARLLPPQQTGGRDVRSLLEDSRGRIWFSGESSVAMFDGESFNTFGPDRGLPSGEAFNFAEDAAGAIWAAHATGVFRQGDDGAFAEVKTPQDNSILGITCMQADDDGAVWMGSSERGLLRWKGNRIDALEERTYIPFRAIHGMVADAEGALWMTSRRGILRAHFRDLNAVADGRTALLRYQVFDTTDGMPRAELSNGRQPTCTRDARGRLWFATGRGVVRAEPATLRLNKEPPPVSVTGISFQGRTGMASRLSIGPKSHHQPRTRLPRPYAQPLTLPAGSRLIEIDYLGLCLTAPDKVRYQIKLEDHESDWQDAANRRTAYYHELQPRTYVFRVRAANDDGLWNEEPATLAFIVRPHLWQTVWFKGLVLVTLAFAACAAGRWRAVRLQKERAAQHAFAQQLIQSQETERNRLAVEIHDGLGQDLLLIKNRLALAAARKSDSAELDAQLEEAAKATRRAIGEARAVSQALRPAALEQVGLTKSIEWMVDQIREGSGTQYSTDLDDIDDLFSPEEELHIFRVIQEGLNNIVQHANATCVILELKRKGATAHVSLLDDGCGFDAHNLYEVGEKKRGLGLASMEERIAVLRGSLHLQSARGRGTRLTVRIPLPEAKH